MNEKGGESTVTIPADDEMQISKEDFSKLTKAQQFSLTQYGYFLSPEDAEVARVRQESEALSFCQTNGKRVHSFFEPIAPFWKNPRRKLLLILGVFVLEFIFTLPWSIFAVLSASILVMFPVGLVALWTTVSYEKQSLFAGLGWLLYFGILTTIMISDNKNTVRMLFIVLGILLILNAGGCQVLGNQACAHGC